MSQSILITGCSSGIGLRAAEILKQRGYQVFATARKPADIEMLNSKGLRGVQLDLRDTASIQRCLAEVLQTTNGTLDALFNNAGMMLPGAVEDISQEQIRTQFETNVYGPIELIRQVLPIMYKQGHGRIIQNSSVLGFVTLPYSSAYSASKFALEAFTSGLRQELHGSNIYIVSILPGPISSKLRDHSYEQYKSSDFSHSRHTQVYKKMEQNYFPNRDNFYTSSPDAVVKKLIKALESKRPCAHYHVGFVSYMFAVLKRILPSCALDLVTRKVR